MGRKDGFESHVEVVGDRDGDGQGEGDDIRLVEIGRRNDVGAGAKGEAEDLELGPGQIQVRSDYFVSRE